MNIADYIVLAFILLVPILIGAYFGYRNQIINFFGLDVSKHNSALSEYLIASSEMSATPIAFSLLATFVSTNTLLGKFFLTFQFLFFNTTIS